ncbi:MAG: argininosuccinate lyase [Chloroflexi bacterium]|nr:argininosuccinate lyase [Chloroflexota bacterium]
MADELSTTPADFLASLPYDRRLASYDVRGSEAWARALERAGVLTSDETQAIVGGLESVRGELESGEFPFRLELEDIHFNVERRLIELIGPLGGKLHTGRSRNDQIATDTRLYVKDAIAATLQRLKAYCRALLDQAEQGIDVVLPGYTHLQRAQPVLLAHHLLAYVEMAERDAGRLADALTRADVMPLGSAALTGTAYPIDRDALAADLDFATVSRNSMDAVADRDYVIEFLSAAALTMTHLSRLCEEIILWSSDEFGFVRVGGDYASGSSIMPQKRNPDIAELVRGKTGRVNGDLVALLTSVKGLPLAYNRDLQEDKEPLFDAADTLLGSLEMMAGMIQTLEFNDDSMRSAAESGFLLATELADYLAAQGSPFRAAHEIAHSLVQTALEEGKQLRDLTLEDYRRASERFEQDVLGITVESAIAKRDIVGGTAPSRVRDAITAARARLESSES